jgi:hypothetical protein
MRKSETTPAPVAISGIPPFAPEDMKPVSPECVSYSLDNVRGLIASMLDNSYISPCARDYNDYYAEMAYDGAYGHMLDTLNSWFKNDDDGRLASGAGNRLTCLYTMAYTMGAEYHERYMMSDGGDAPDCAPHAVDRDALMYAATADAYFSMCHLLTHRMYSDGTISVPTTSPLITAADVVADMRANAAALSNN